MVGGALPPRLAREAERAEAAARAVGLDFFEVVFELLDARDVNAIAAYGGFPTRYPSWRFGMDFERLQKGYGYGLSKIYELVINNDPTIAYLVRSNSLMEQKLVMAHVMGHADFFKHNVWFAPTERHMVEQMTSHAERVRELIARHGQDAIERFLDRALALESLLDPFGPLRRMQQSERAAAAGRSIAERARLSLEALMDADGGARAAPAVSASRQGRFALPTFDILPFLVEHAPLESFERELLRIIHAEAEYFLPQRMTKVINEGWASFWHSRLLTGGLLDASEIVDFADCHAGATAAAPGQLNPYKLGIELFRHAEALGEDLFRLRRVHNDVSFVDALVDAEFAARNQLFVRQRNARTGRQEVGERGWRQVKQELLQGLAWGGQPRIELVDADFEGGGGLLLVHRHDGRDLKLDEAGELLKTIAALWRRSVRLYTLQEGQGRVLVVDGGEPRVLDSSKALAFLEGEASRDDVGERFGPAA
ncbi:MAG: SpoVR family protein [Planctomycetota bacterium]